MEEDYRRLWRGLWTRLCRLRMKSAGIHSLFKRLRRRMEDAPGDCDNRDGGVDTLEARHGYDKNGVPATRNTSWQQKNLVVLGRGAKHA